MLALTQFDWPILLRLRTLGFSCGLFMSLAFPLALSSLLAPPQAACLAHFSYPLGEGLALMACASTYQRNRTTYAVHLAFTVGWATFIGWGCRLWTALATGSPAALHQSM